MPGCRRLHQHGEVASGNATANARRAMVTRCQAPQQTALQGQRSGKARRTDSARPRKHVRSAHYARREAMRAMRTHARAPTSVPSRDVALPTSMHGHPRLAATDCLTAIHRRCSWSHPLLHSRAARCLQYANTYIFTATARPNCDAPANPSTMDLRFASSKLDIRRRRFRTRPRLAIRPPARTMGHRTASSGTTQST